MPQIVSNFLGHVQKQDVFFSPDGSENPPDFSLGDCNGQQE
jgi:hypothetical protein